METTYWTSYGTVLKKWREEWQACRRRAVECVDMIAAVSYFGVQLYQQHFRQHFRSIPDATAMFKCYQYAFLPSTAFLCLLASPPKATPSGLELASADLSAFETLYHASPRLIMAAKRFHNYFTISRGLECKKHVFWSFFLNLGQNPDKI